MESLRKQRVNRLIRWLKRRLRSLESARMAVGRNLWLIFSTDRAKLQRCISILFAPEEHESVLSMLDELGSDPHQTPLRLKLAAVRCSGGALERLRRAIELGQQDFRDLLMSAGFGDPDAHLKWVPRPFHQRDADDWLAGIQIDGVDFDPDEDAWILTTILRTKKETKIISLYALEPTVIYWVRHSSGKEGPVAQTHLVKRDITNE